MPLVFLGAAFIFDFIGVYGFAPWLLMAAWLLLALGLLSGLIVVADGLWGTIRGVREGRMQRRALVHPLAHLAIGVLVALALLVRPMDLSAVPMASMALTVVAGGCWLMVEQFREELRRPKTQAKRRARALLRLVASRR
jgi:hypothetical protein